MSTATTEGPLRNRKRATSACLNCRNRRIRCTKESREASCVQCRTVRLPCVFDDRDGRKNRLASKGVANHLEQRIEELERTLKRNRESKPLPLCARKSPNIGCRARSTEPGETIRVQYEVPELTGGQDDQAQDDIPSMTEDSSIPDLAPRPVRFDMSSGKLRFFGSTTNVNVYYREPAALVEAQWPIAVLIGDFPQSTHDYLMSLYWGCHNSIVHLIHKHAFYDDMERGGTILYSNFLHMCILGAGFRFADKSRPDMQKLMSTDPNVSSVLHAKAKKMAEMEIQRTNGIPSIQGLILLGALEAGCGRDDTGWVFFGMAMRIVFEIGMHVDSSELQVSDRERQIRHMLLWACIVYDRYWALYLGRPTSLKTCDIAPSCLQKDFSLLLSCRSSEMEKTLETRVYEALMQLMDLTDPLCSPSLKRQSPSSEAYYNILSHDRELNHWYDGLPDDLKLTDSNLEKAPASLFLLHSQYHRLMILLHREFINADVSQAVENRGPQPDQLYHFFMMSRKACVESAIQIAIIFERYRLRFDFREAFMSAMQHIGSAATALIVEMEFTKNLKDATEHPLLRYLVVLGDCMREVSENYQSAKMMLSVVNHFTRNMSGHPVVESRQTSPVTESSQKEQPYTMEYWEMMDMDSSFLQPTPGSSVVRDDEALSGMLNTRSGLPMLPASWFQENWDDDADFLNLIGLKEVQNTAYLGQFQHDYLEFFTAHS